MIEYSEDSFVSKYRKDQFYSSLLTSFNRDLKNVLENLNLFIKKNNVSEAIELCHQMAGASATYGYPILGKVFEELEKNLERCRTVDEGSLAKFEILKEFCNRVIDTNGELVID